MMKNVECQPIQRKRERYSRLWHPTRPLVCAVVGLDGHGHRHLDVLVEEAPLFRFQLSTGADVEVYQVMVVLVLLGFFSRHDVLHAIRWSPWFEPEEINHVGVRRAARLLNALHPQATATRGYDAKVEE